MGPYLHVIILVISTVSVKYVEPQRAKDNMYENIDGASACFRRLNGTHQFGCTSHRSGNVGTVHIIYEKVDLDWLLNEGLAAPYVAVLRPAMFSKSVLSALKSSGKVNGVLLINNGSSDIPSEFSHEDTCPNRYSGLSSQKMQTCGAGQNSVWNPKGTTIMFEDWGFPIFFVTQQLYIDSVFACAHNHNKVDHPVDQLEKSLCAMQLRSHMFAAGNSGKCMRRNEYFTMFSQVTFCDPLGGRNIWQTLFPRSTHNSSSYSTDDASTSPVSVASMEANRSIAVLATRLDASSFFDGLVPGAAGAITGVVTLLSTAEVLHRMLPNKETYDKNVLFLFLTGESYDYIGSSRVVYDMEHSVFPVRPDPNVPQPPPIGLHHLGPFIEVSQVFNTKKKSFYIHRTSNSDSKVSDVVTILQRIGKSMGLTFSTELPPSNNLPPASLQTFLASDPDIPGMVLTDHALEYSNPYYHSVYDDEGFVEYYYANGSQIPEDTIQMYITNLSTVLAHTLYEHVTGGPYTGVAVANPNLVDEMFHCYFENSNCSLFRSATAGNTAGLGKPLSAYVGVSTWPSLTTLLTGAALALLTGKPTDHNETYCHNNASVDQVFQYIWVNSEWDNPNSSQVCMQTTMNFSVALSPAFIIDDYNMSSGQYSTWTESVWPELRATMFLKPSFRHEVLTLCVGLAVLFLSFAGVYFVKARKEILFNPGSEEERAPLISNQPFAQVFA